MPLLQPFASSLLFMINIYQRFSRDRETEATVVLGSHLLNLNPWMMEEGWKGAKATLVTDNYIDFNYYVSYVHTVYVLLLYVKLVKVVLVHT